MPIYMKIEGVDGDVSTAGHEKWIEIQSWSWGATQLTGHGGGGGGGAGKVSLSDFSIVKSLDKASPKLFLACCNGKHFSSVKIECTRDSNDREQTYLRYELKEVMVSSWQTSASDGSGVPTENVSLNYAEVSMNQQNRDGSTGGATWNIKTNRGGLTGDGSV